MLVEHLRPKGPSALAAARSQRRHARRQGLDGAEPTLQPLRGPDGRPPLRQDLHKRGALTGSVLLRTNLRSDRRAADAQRLRW